MKFSAKTCHSTRIRWPVAGRCDASRFKRGYHYIFTVIDLLSKHAAAQSQKRKQDDEDDWKIKIETMEDVRKIYILRGKEFYNSGVQKLLKKQHQLLFYVFRNEGLNRWTVQLYVKERRCGNNLCIMEITNGSCHNGNYKWISYQITTLASIKLLVCIPSPLSPRLSIGS